MPTNVFISYVYADQRLVPLLERILDSHGISVCRGESRLKGGERFRAAIEAQLRRSDALLVVSSPGARSSLWVRHEVDVFHSFSPERKVIPLVLDEGEEGQVGALHPALEGVQAVRFDRSWLTGFEDLFAALGLSFLGRGRQPRSNADRRQADHLQRLRRGMWKVFHASTEPGKFDLIPIMTTDRIRMVRILNEEIIRYRVSSLTDGQELDPTSVLEITVHRVCESLGAREARAIYVIELIAEAVDQAYRLTPRDRREGDSSAAQEIGACAGDPEEGS